MSILERILLFVLLVLASGAGQGIFANPNVTTTAEGQPLTQVAFAGLYLAFFLILLWKFRKTALFLILKEKWTLILCTWVLASTLWSVGPGETIRRALALVGTSIVGLYIGMRFEPKQQLKMIALIAGIGAVGSLAAGLLFPGIGVTADGSWQGVYFPKNSLGRMMALSAICFALLALGQRRHRPVRIAMFLLSCLLLVLSKSATAVVVCFLVFALFPFRKLLYLRPRTFAAVSLVGGVVVAGLALWTADHLDDLLLSLGRTSSLTGRIPLWGYVIKAIGDRPLMGYGFGAFWNSWAGERVSDAAAWEVAVPHAHNGFLEMGLGIGFIGLAILGIGMVTNFISAVRVARSSPEVDQAWPLLLIIFTVLYNLTETSLLAVNSLMWMAYVANAFWLVRTTQEHKYVEQPQELPEHAYSS